MTIRNDHNVAHEISDITYNTGGMFSVQNPPALPYTLPYEDGSDTLTLEVLFDPTAIGDFSDTLTITTDSTGQETLEIALKRQQPGLRNLRVPHSLTRLTPKDR